MTWRLLLYALLGYAALVLLLFAIQRKLLYLPGDFRLSPAAAVEEGLRHWPSADDYRGLVAEPDDGEPSATMIVFHGNAGAASHRLYYPDALVPRGLRVILAEYPGYGGRPGEPSEAVMVQDALETLRLAHRQFGEPLLLWGESLGAAVVAAVVAKSQTPVEGLALLTPWDSLANLAQRHYWFLPVRWLLRDRYDSVKNLRGFEGPVAVILAGEDEVVPVAHGQRLFESIQTPRKRVWVFPGATHNRMPLGPGLAWWDEVIEQIAGGR